MGKEPLGAHQSRLVPNTWSLAGTVKMGRSRPFVQLVGDMLAESRKRPERTGEEQPLALDHFDERSL